MVTPKLNHEIKQICREMEDFQASASVANTGTGSRHEGTQFER